MIEALKNLFFMQHMPLFANYLKLMNINK